MGIWKDFVTTIVSGISADVLQITALLENSRIRTWQNIDRIRAGQVGKRIRKYLTKVKREIVIEKETRNTIFLKYLLDGNNDCTRKTK